MRHTVVRNRGCDGIGRYIHIVVIVIIGVVISACSAGPVQTNPGRVPPQSPTVKASADGCPAIAAKASGAPVSAAVDYVDFVVVGRTMYLAGHQPVPRVERTELDEIVMTSRCSFRELNDRTGQLTPMPGDGDTGYLRPGTPVYAIRDWSPACWLAAEHDGELHVYLAQQDGGIESRSAACAVS